MKRYLLFGFSYWYPSGGMSDLIDSFESWEELDAYYKEHEIDYGSSGEHQVFDMEERKGFKYPSKEEIDFDL